MKHTVRNVQDRRRRRVVAVGVARGERAAPAGDALGGVAPREAEATRSEERGCARAGPVIVVSGERIGDDLETRGEGGPGAPVPARDAAGEGRRSADASRGSTGGGTRGLRAKSDPATPARGVAGGMREQQLRAARGEP